MRRVSRCRNTRQRSGIHESPGVSDRRDTSLTGVGERASCGCLLAKRSMIRLRSRGFCGRLCLPVHPMAVHRLAVPLVLFLMQVQARGAQRHVPEIVADRSQIDAAVCLMGTRGVSQPMRRGSLQFIVAIRELWAAGAPPRLVV